VNNIIKIKDAFSKLPAKKIIEIHNMVNNKKKIKPRINMITKGPSKKQVIILMSTNNLEAIISQANMHIMNINHLLKDAKSDISANFICFDNKGVIITTNKAIIVSDLNFIEKYIKDINNIDLKDISSPHFSQSKSYLKILGIPYLLENPNLLITSNIIKKVIKSSYLFNNLTLASYPQIIKAFPKLDIAIVWIDI